MSVRHAKKEHKKSAVEEIATPEENPKREKKVISKETKMIQTLQRGGSASKDQRDAWCPKGPRRVWYFWGGVEKRNLDATRQGDTVEWNTNLIGDRAI